MTNVLPTNKKVYEVMDVMKLTATNHITQKKDNGFSNKNHCYDDRDPATLDSMQKKFELKENEWTRPTYYAYGYKASFKKKKPSSGKIVIRERHFSWESAKFIHEVTRTFQFDEESIYRPAGTYISITSASGTLEIDADKDFDGDAG